MSNKETHSRDVARILGNTAVRAYKMPIEDIIPAFDEAEAECLALPAPAEELKLEVRRRVAEWKVHLFCEHNAPFEMVEKLYKDVAALGFTNLEIEATIEIVFARYCARQGRTEDARRILRRFLARLDMALETLEPRDLEVYPYFLEVHDSIKKATEKLLSKLNSE